MLVVVLLAENPTGHGDLPLSFHVLRGNLPSLVNLYRIFCGHASPKTVFLYRLGLYTARLYYLKESGHQRH